MLPSVGQRLAEILTACDTRAVFGVPGGQTLSLYQALENAPIQHVLMRDERSAACAADAFARLSGRIGFCDATVGPGASNLLSGLAEAYGASIPVIAIVADISRGNPHLRRRSVVSQATDQHGFLASETKWVGRVERADALDPVMSHAFRVATTGRPGPVVVEIPEDLFMSDEPVPRSHEFEPHELRYPRHAAPAADEGIAAAVEMIARAERPILLAGGGVTLGGAAEAVAALAEAQQIPVATTISGKGAIDERSPLAAGVTGAFGTEYANASVLAADLVVALGCKFSQLATHGWTSPRLDQSVIHIDRDGEELGRTRPVELEMCADAGAAADALRHALAEVARRGRNWLAARPALEPTPKDERVAPDAVVRVIDAQLAPGDTLLCDASLSSGWAAANFRVKRAGRAFLAPRGLAGIGWSGGASIGARLAAEERLVVLAGDGGWAYALSEVETAARLGLDIIYVILNNAANGWIKHLQDPKGAKPSVFTDVDFSAVATAMGARGARCATLGEFEDAFVEALARRGPSLVEVLSSVDRSPIVSIGSFESPYSV